MATAETAAKPPAVLSEEQLRILRHMLGIDTRQTASPVECRDYYCANQGDPELIELERLGMVRRYRRSDSYDWYTTTDAGKAAARASQRAGLLPLSQRRYLRFLNLREPLPDLSFREFLTHPDFAEYRRNP